MLKKISIAVLILLFFVVVLFLSLNSKEYRVTDVISPVEIVLDKDRVYKIDGFDCFDSHFTEKNKILSEKLGISENEAFIIGNLGKYWAENLLKGRNVKTDGEKLNYYKFSYNIKFLNSPFCIKSGEPINKQAYERLLRSVRNAKYGIVKDDVYYPVSREFDNGDYILMRRSHYNKIFLKTEKSYVKEQTKYFYINNIKLIVADMSKKLKPDRNCSDDICREILNRINNSETSIDIAIYGYSSTPAIENGLKQALKRGIKIRLVYDSDSAGQNIYPDTFKFVNLFPDNMSDKNSKSANNIMHNKFYIFDDKSVITGSANLSHTDMSGFNTNNILLINSAEIAKLYKQEFEQMYSGRFHTDKKVTGKNNFENLEVYFSPQDKPLTNGIIPRIKNARKYIYLPVFFVTDKNITEELINAKKRGVDVKIIIDALGAANKYSKHEILRQAGVPVKTENYAGKMHTKTIVIDDEYLILGSMNFSVSGNCKNDENLVVLKNREAAVFYKNFFLYLWNKIPDKWLKYNARPESKDSIGSCSDGLDNDYDGLVDSKDDGCR